MYCSKETKDLAVAKGYKVCSCSCGGYPDCICDENPYHPVRLDDLVRWLLTNHKIYVVLKPSTNLFIWHYIVYRYTPFLDGTLNSIWKPIKDYDECFNNGIKAALDLI